MLRITTKARFIYPSYSWKYDRILKKRSFSLKCHSILIIHWGQYGKSIFTPFSFVGTALRLVWKVDALRVHTPVLFQWFQFSIPEPLKPETALKRMSFSTLHITSYFQQYNRIFNNTIAFSTMRSHFQEYDSRWTGPYTYISVHSFPKTNSAKYQPIQTDLGALNAISAFQ